MHVLSKPHRIVVKIGTSSICHKEGALNLRKIELLARVLSDLSSAGHEVVLVTSGAIMVGARKMGARERPRSIAQKQAAAAIGQCELMSIYDRFFMEYGTVTGQLLLTKDVVSYERARANVIATFQELLGLGAVPIVNENDSVATEEIEFGDNDSLSAIVATLVEADLLVILSDIEGLYTKDPSVYADAKLVREVTCLDEVRVMAGDTHTQAGTGGMVTKLNAVEIAFSKNIPVIIASGKDPRLLYEICEQKPVGTLFYPEET